MNPHEHEIENMKVRMRCPECRTTFAERLNRVIHSNRVRCPTRRDERHFHGVGQIHDHESMADYIHHVAEHTCHPHFSLGRRPSIYLLVYDFVGKLLPSFRHHALVNKLRRPPCPDHARSLTHLGSRRTK